MADNPTEGGGAVAVEVRPLTIEEIEERLTKFESHFNTPSEAFILAFRNGQLVETDEYREWAMLISARRVLMAD